MYLSISNPLDVTIPPTVPPFPQFPPCHYSFVRGCHQPGRMQ